LLALQVWDHCGLERLESLWNDQRDQVGNIQIRQQSPQLIRFGVLSLSLSTWLEALPAVLKLNSHSIKSALPHVLTMHLSWASFVIMLHKPFYRPVAQLPSGGPLANVNAETVVKVSVVMFSCLAMLARSPNRRNTAAMRSSGAADHFISPDLEQTSRLALCAASCFGVLFHRWDYASARLYLRQDPEETIGRFAASTGLYRADVSHGRHVACCSTEARST
jgi:hypothetical protein